MLSTQQIELVQSTIPVLRENGAALTGYFYQRMLKNSPELKEVFNMGHQRSGGQATALADAVLAYAENIQQLEVLGDAVQHIVSKHVSLNIQPEQYDIVGENLLHSISEVLSIPMDSELISAWGSAYQQLADILIAAEKSAYANNLAQKNGWEGWKDFVVVRKEQESDTITSFYLSAVDGSPLPDYKAGQFISVRVHVSELGFKQPRQYTLSDCSNNQVYRISVKRENGQDELADGYVSCTLHQKINVGDRLELTCPAGNFFLKNGQKENVFISAGVGITPMISMLMTLKEQGAKQPITFIHACQNDQVLAMNQQISEAKSVLPQLQTYLACELASDSVVVNKVGRLDLTELDKILLPKQADYYICGPLEFMKKQHDTLLKLGIAHDQIHMELFNTGGIA
ncbi:NO-inducible flavohemoprotein [Wohlfahrtiimonas larvae]|uniref:nitric oxide dioxygenase n=1 Tax=Wohlfahrtiimonas larvae TaxID=1157986 RepID=A0ABP9MIX2_9GAMM|nr:NO-inducible flavohemoprotein [Wohlfahrtiimonas larvae]